MSEFDTIPQERYGDWHWLWTMQISGQKNFDSCSLAGALNGLQSTPDWRSIFDPIKGKAGMKEFMDRLQAHHNRSVRTNFSGKVDPIAMVELTQRHVGSLVEAYRRSGRNDKADRLASFSITWEDSPNSYHELDGHEQLDVRDGRPAGFYLFEAWEFSYCLYKINSPKIAGDLEEAIYYMSADYALQRYLMQSFTTHNLDVDAQYELEWLNKCIFYFDKNACYVTTEKIVNA